MSCRRNPCDYTNVYFATTTINYIARGVGSSFGLVRQLNIGQANVPGGAGCTMATMLKMTNF